MTRALFGGEPAPVELSDYLLRHRFWTELGVRGSELDAWPEVKVQRYLIVIDAVDKWQEAEMEKERRRASAAARPGGR